jgi:hypothetical protein
MAPATAAGTAPPPSTSTGPPAAIPLYPGEAVVARFENSPEGQAKVVRFNGMVLVGIMAVIWVPFIIILAFQRPFDPVLLILPAFLLLFIGLSWSNVRRVRRYRPAQVFVTDRRVIVQESGRDATSAAIGLENLGNVEIKQSSRSARSAGVTWVYFLPLGTTKAMVGGGRHRHAAPGVVWVPAVPVASAQQLQTLVLTRARELQARLGFTFPR